jgi:hypothetical protein
MALDKMLCVFASLRDPSEVRMAEAGVAEIV